MDFGGYFDDFDQNHLQIQMDFDQMGYLVLSVRILWGFLGGFAAISSIPEPK